MIVKRAEAERRLGRPLSHKMKGRDGRSYPYWILSESGAKLLGGPYTMPEAKRRLAQIEHFKRQSKSNPSTPFLERDHNWSEVLVRAKGKKYTRQYIIDHYMKHARKIWPYLKGQTVIVILATPGGLALRRKGPDGHYIKLKKLYGMEDPHSLEYWVYRRAIEFHPVIEGRKTPHVWIDMDMHTTKSKRDKARLMAEMRAAIPVAKKVLREMGAQGVKAFHSGSNGVHVEGSFRSARDVDAVRKKLRKKLEDHFEIGRVFSLGPAKAGQIRLDTTMIKELGSLRAPYSFTAAGGFKRPI